MRQTVAQFICNCDTYACIKPVRHTLYGLLKLLEVPFWHWSSISLDLVTGLPMSNGFDVLLVVVDYLSKIAHYISSTSYVNSKQIAKQFFNNIFKLHGILDSIISDCSTQFISELTCTLTALVGIQQKMFTSFHLQTDGQTEHVNAIIEQYLHGYYNYQQDNCIELLTLAEFSYNNTLLATIGMTPFQAIYGTSPRYNINPNLDTKNPMNAITLNFPPSAVIQEYANNLAKLDAYLHHEITWAQATHAEQSNKHRLPPPKLEVSDEVWLLRKHVKTTWPSRKLDFKHLGKFKIIKKVSPYAYKLDLPATMKIHPIFHVSLLEPAASDPLPGQIHPPPPPVIMEDEPQ